MVFKQLYFIAISLFFAILLTFFIPQILDHETPIGLHGSIVEALFYVPLFCGASGLPGLVIYFVLSLHYQKIKTQYIWYIISACIISSINGIGLVVVWYVVFEGERNLVNLFIGHGNEMRSFLMNYFAAGFLTGSFHTLSLKLDKTHK